MKHIIAANPQEMAELGANMIWAQVLLKPDCVLGLATGSTPLGVYARLIERYQKNELSFQKTRSVNLDEYCNMPAQSPHSYRYYMNTNFFDHIDIHQENTYLPDGMAQDFYVECARYNQQIDALGGIDLQLLGIGHNGHIGFNEPADHFSTGTNYIALTDSTRAANAVHFPGGLDEMPTAALTMGMRHIMQAKRVLLVAGPEKAAIVEAALYGPVTPQVPASILQLHGDLTVVSCK